MKNVFRKTAMVGVLLVLSACTSGPRTVRASLALVTPSMEKPNKKAVPAQYWVLLADQKQSHLAHELYSITLSPLYFSALGLTCRELLFEDDNQVKNKRVACENNFLDENNKTSKGWFFENELIESSNDLEM